MKKLVSTLMILAMLIPSVGAQSTDIFKKKKKKKGKTEEVAKVKTDSVANRKKDALQPYARVITGKAKTMNGFFKVHNVEGRYYFEIPDSLFGRDVLIETYPFPVIDPILFALPLSVLAIVGISLLTYKKY